VISLIRFRTWPIAAVLILGTTAGMTARDTYERTIERWRAQREVELKADDGWLTVAGLFWLKPGLNHAGADPANEVALPAGRAPARLGAFDLRDERVVFVAEPGTGVTVGGEPARRADLTPGPRAPSIIVGDLTMFIIKRGDRFGVRMRDRHSALRREFTGLRWYPIDGAYRVTARFVAYPVAKTILVPNIIGDTPAMQSPGFVEFTMSGQTLRLEPVLESSDADELFFIVGDATNGHGTYGAGRFLYTDLPRDGRVVLDFNKLENPPCAFTPFATCPLPPPQNKLAVSIEAGELDYGHAHGR
jgi:uncharacterized protein (DUF1684 family)